MNNKNVLSLGTVGKGRKIKLYKEILNLESEKENKDFNYDLDGIYIGKEFNKPIKIIFDSKLKRVDK